MACPDFIDALERILLQMYAVGLEIMLDNELLLLENDGTLLHFRRQDWE